MEYPLALADVALDIFSEFKMVVGGISITNYTDIERNGSAMESGFRLRDLINWCVGETTKVKDGVYHSYSLPIHICEYSYPQTMET